MLKDEYYRFTEMLRKAKVSRATLYRMIKKELIGSKEIIGVKLYSYKDVINNKPHKK